MAQRSLYVETFIRADLERVWELTQDPGLHARWDGRFTDISYLPRVDGEPQAFRYAVRWVPGLSVAGVGTTVGERRRADGSRTSALRFSSPSPLSPIRSGSGYWRYVPAGDGVRFLTGYDYRPGWQGAVLDSIVVRPLMGVLTAWSFDRLRLWAERGIPPEVSTRRAVTVAGARLGAAAAALRWVERPWLRTALVAAALALPTPAVVPKARRCLRRPPDRLASTPPSTLSNLAAPEGES